MTAGEQFSLSDEAVARAVCGVYLMVAFSDGTYEKSEEVRMIAGLAGESVPTGMNKSVLLAVLPDLEKAFKSDYEKAVTGVLSMVSEVCKNNTANRAIKQAARVAIVANQSISLQENQALDRISEALGLEPGVL